MLKLSASKWEKQVAEDFLEWRRTSGVLLEGLGTFGMAIEQTLKGCDFFSVDSGQVAATLELALRCCNRLKFDDITEARAYASLHLLDRYGRVNQVLEYLIRNGRLPLRIRGATALELGAGPAPALYAVRDFYAALLQWPERGDVSIGPLAVFHTLERGSAWSRFLGLLSELLPMVRSDGPERGALGFGTTVDNFDGFDVLQRHRRSIEERAFYIEREFERHDDPITPGEAMQIAQARRVDEPSAYDLIFACNFLTETEMVDAFEIELDRLARSLTPGGVLIVLGAIGPPYPEIYKAVRQIPGIAWLRDVSPEEPFRANADQECLGVIAEHVRANVSAAFDKLAIDSHAAVKSKLSDDLTDVTAPFTMPMFRALIFVNQRPSNQRKCKR